MNCNYLPCVSETYDSKEDTCREVPITVTCWKLKCQTEINVIPSLKQTSFNSESNEASWRIS